MDSELAEPALGRKNELAERAMEDIRVEDYSDITEGYLRNTRMKTAFILAMILSVLILSIVTIRLGASNLSYMEILRTLIYMDDPVKTWTVYDWRMPIIVAAILCGCILGLAGSVMQGVLRNPLASPSTLGISSAAAFGAGFGIMILGGGAMAAQTISDPYIVTTSAFVFALISVGVILLLIRFTDATPETIILAGVAIGAIFSSALGFLQYFADEATLSTIVFWQFGSLSKVSWSNIPLITAALVLAFLYFLYKRWDYNAMEAGDDMASSLGVNIHRTRIAGLVVTSLITAIIVSFMGVISFVGLIGPHIVKRLIGNDYRYQLVGSMLVGAAVMLISNIFAAHILPAAMGSSVPVGMVTSVIGGPVFIAILIGRRKKT